jgi:hypothetical protein
MIVTNHRPFAALFVLLVVGLPVRGEDSPRAKITRTGKAATAFVQGKNSGTQATAFCIHPAGIFLTNEHVVCQGGPFALFLNGGTKNVKILSAKVLRTDKDLDLALLQAEGQKDLPALALATGNNLSETDELIAFGFPFGELLSAEQKQAPPISVNVGKVTSLHEKNGELHRIQLDAVLNPGNSGGPVLNLDGKVVGVVVSGFRGAGINYAVPVNHVHRFLARPELLFQPPSLTLANVHEPAEFQVQALTFEPSAARAMDLEFILKTEGQKARTFKMNSAGGSYRVRAVPVPRPEGPAVFRLLARYDRGSVVGEVADQSFQVGGTSTQFSEVRRIVGGADPRVWLRNGKVLRGKLSGVEGVSLQLGSILVRVDLAQAAEVRLRPPAGLSALAATVVARRDGREVGRLTHSLLVQGVPQPGDVEVYLDLEPAPLERDVVDYKLEAPVADVAVGGGGRYLILHLPKLRQLAVFDVNKAKVVKFLPAAEGNLKFVAGLDQLVVALPGAGTLQRWNLKTMEQERSAPYPVKGEILALSLGSASQGPLFVLTKEGPGIQLGFCALGLDDLKRREAVWSKIGHHHGPFPQDLHMRSSLDNKAIGLWSGGVSPAGVTWIRWDYPIARSTYSHSGNGHVIPGPGGKVLFTSQGMFTRLAFPNQNDLYPGSDPLGRYVPAHHSDYYLNLGAGQTFRDRNPPRAFSIHKLGIDRSILQMDIEVPGTEGSGNKGDFTLDKRFHLIPEAKVLIVIPPSNDRLILHRVDLEAALAKMGRGKD